MRENIYASVRRSIVFGFLWISLASLMVTCGPTFDESSVVEEQMNKMATFLDSAEYETQVSWQEYLVLSYKLAQARSPTIHEFAILQGLRDQVGLTRSQALALVMQGEDARLTEEEIRRFLYEVNKNDFIKTDQIKTQAQQLAMVSKAEIFESIKSQDLDEAEIDYDPIELLAAEPDQSYSIYFGFLHAHSKLSDGSGSAEEAYKYARDQGGLDFFALTDHGELLNFWPWQNKWDKLRDAADAYDSPGQFAALWGFEWSSPIFGHINVINSEDYTDCIRKLTISKIFSWIASRPNAIARFNHPGDFNFFGAELSKLRYSSNVDTQMVGIELWNGNKSFDRYHYSGGYESDYGYIDEANRQGWHLGSLGAQDNHSKDWGTMNKFRTAVLAEELSREGIIKAYRQRRFYSTEDGDLHLDLRCSGYPMGARLSNATRQFEVLVCDGSGDSFNEVRLYRNGDMVQSATQLDPATPLNHWNVDPATCVRVSLSDHGRTGEDYYYVIVTQNDDNDQNGRNDEAISSPIWILSN